jgi:hypothetical protein
MIHDQNLLDRLSVLPTERFEGEVFRATRVDANPTAPSINGGRWAPPPNGDPGIYVLYTSLERDGAMAEVVSFLADFTPIPGPRPVKLTRLLVSTSKTLRLVRARLETFAVDLVRYGERDYGRTQQIGAALSFLGLDGLIAPSARWACENLMIFTENHALTERLDPVSSEQLEWQTWARSHGFLPDNMQGVSAERNPVIQLDARRRRE